MTPTTQTCAAELLEVVPMIMRAMRAEVRHRRLPELSLPQFRALAFIGRNADGALTDVAAFLGLGLPSTSKLIDGLVDAGFVTRETAAGDRRRVQLALSPAGHAKYKAMVRQSRNFLAGKVAHFTEAQCRQLSEVLAALRQIFEKDPPSEVVRHSARINKRPASSHKVARTLSEKTPYHA